MTRAAPRRVPAPMPVLLLATFALGACARETPPLPAPAGLDGQRIMLLPVRAADPASLNDELMFWLADRSPATEWLSPDQLQQAVDRAAGWRVRLNTLPRQIADPGRSAYVPDPTYGVLRQLGAVVDAMLVLMPIAVQAVPEGDGQVLEMTAALVDIRGGRVLWVTTVRGEPGDGSARAAEAAVAAALARALFPS